MALRAAILKHIRVPVLQTLAPASTASNWQRWIRPMSSHGDDHLQKEEVIERVLSVVKSFPKVDPSQVSFYSSHFSHFCFLFPLFGSQKSRRKWEMTWICPSSFAKLWGSEFSFFLLLCFVSNQMEVMVWYACNSLIDSFGKLFCPCFALQI